MSSQFKVERRVEWHETDAAGIVHFSNFFRYMESCEHAWFRSLGFSVDLHLDGQHFDLPRVNAQCSYLSPLRFEDPFEVHLLVREVRSRALVYDFVVRKTGEPARCVGHGSITVVFSQKGDDGALRSCPIPPSFKERVSPAPSETLARLMDQAS